MHLRAMLLALVAGLGVTISCGSDRECNPPPNTGPTAAFTIDPAAGTPGTAFRFDASGSTDAQDPMSALQVRWDWENDGTWDTDWTTAKAAGHPYGTLGTKVVKLEVRDTGGLTGSTTRVIIVGTAPAVVGTVPPDGAADVALYPIIEIRFSQAMGTSVTDTSNFQIDGVAIRAIVYDETGHTATLYPATIVGASREQEVRVGPDVENDEGIAMGHEVVFHFTTGSLDCRHIRDRFEPNGEPELATPISTDGFYPGLSVCAGEHEDFYRFTLAETRMVQVICETAYCPTAGAGWEIDYLSEETDFRGQEYATLSPHHVVFTTHHTLLAGSYMLRLTQSPFAEWAPYMIYHLKLEDLDPAPDDAYEDNDFFEEATPITTGLHEGLRGTYLDYDCYSIDVASGQTLTAMMTEVSSSGANRVLGIGDPYGTGTYHVNQLNPAVETWKATMSGTYKVTVMWFADNVVYNLNVDLAD
jgi:hypothetical protein